MHNKTDPISVKTEAMKLKQRPEHSTQADRDSWNGFDALTLENDRYSFVSNGVHSSYLARQRFLRQRPLAFYL